VSAGSVTVGRSVALRGRTWPITVPSVRDPRLHAASVVLTIHVLGQVTLGFAVSVPQIVAAILGAALVEFTITAGRHGVLAWPASAMLTGSGVALIMRVDGTAAGDDWTFHRWWWFALVAIGSLVTKYVIRWRGGHLLNPSNVGLVAAFLLLGPQRVEPLPLKWFGSVVGLGMAYALILAGGVLITRRLGLLLMAASFAVVFGAGLALLARSGHCMAVTWSPRPVCGDTFWWTFAASPEVWLFLFFMLTDPRTVPTSPRARVAFGVGVGALATLLIAPQRTEFGAKVGLLVALTIMCAVRPLLAHAGRRWGPRARSMVAPLSSDERGVVVGAAAMVAAVVFAGATVYVGGHAREPQLTISSESLPPVPSIEWSAPQSVPSVTVDPEVLDLDPAMARPAARQHLLLAVLRNLAVEGLLMKTGAGELLAAVDHGARLNELRSIIAGRAPAEPGAIAWPSHTVITADLVVRRAGRQSSAVLTLDVTGTTTHAARTEPWFASIAVRQASDGRWLIVELAERR
jgi:hypothetical protein